MHRIAYLIVNGITWYRLCAAPVLIVLALFGMHDLFAWLLPVSFFTDALDGFLARKYKVQSVAGARLDSIGDDLTVLAAIIGVFVFCLPFVLAHWVAVLVMLVLYLVQTGLAWYKYRRLTSFHTWIAKISAILQGVFLCLLFLLPAPVEPLFYATVVATSLGLIEESVMVILLPRWTSDVRGVYHAIRSRTTLR